MTNLIITFDHLYKRYHEDSRLWAVEDFNLEIYQGEFFCLVGPSGCGKSTLLKIVAGLEKPSRGQIQKPGDIAMVFQSGALFPWLTVLENISFGLRMKGLEDSEVKQRSKKYLDMVELEAFGQKYPRELSGGQRQRVGLARALNMETEVLLLDEPFSALDPLTANELRTDLLKIWRETDKTILMVSHSIEEAVLLAGRIGTMGEGKLTHVVEVKLPRPRSDDYRGFINEVEKIRKML